MSPKKTTEAAEPATTDRTMFWAIAFLIAVAVFGAGYAVGHAVAEDDANDAFGGDIALEGHIPGHQTDHGGSDEVIAGQGFLGITGRDTPGAVLVVDVLPESPADKAGIHSGDRVVAFDGESIVSMEQLSDLVRHTEPGTEVEMVLGGLDGGRTVSVIVGERH